jgi:hypothetical protein
MLPMQDAQAETTFVSAPGKTQLLELYTSEGCSSCPPAEAWVSKLQNHPRLWRDFAPLAFHVSYWDRLGWRDPFASKEWTARQYRYASTWSSGTVYTPGFVLDGREWRGNGSVPAPSRDEPGVLRVSLGNENVSASFAPTATSAKPLELHVARVGFGLSTDVKAGENRGRKLAHDFVVLGVASSSLDDGKAQVRFPAAVTPAAAGARRLALVAWVTEADSLVPIQTTGGWLP